MSYIFLLRGNLLVWQQQKQQQIEGQVAERGKETEKETFHLIIHSPNGLAQTRSQELLPASPKLLAKFQAIGCLLPSQEH